MTATFGKLSNRTLKLEPGLNVISGPNEWGKSTWCAFLVAMLYGIDTSTRTKRDFLAEKEHYAPWSGEPMSGRMALQWNGRDITIERHTKGRTVFGEFKAYETATGLPVPELTAQNCGQQLLGGENNVFLRAGFLRLADLPVTQDEALRKRLNALVTSGDESDSGDLLAQKLKELKNRCRFHNSGLLPQAESHREELRGKLDQLRMYEIQMEKIKTRQQELKAHEQKLLNHKAALAYAQAEIVVRKAEQAKLQQQMAQQQVTQLQAACRKLPEPEQLNYRLSQVRTLSEQWEALQMEAQLQPVMPGEPDGVTAFRGLTPQQAKDRAQEDVRQYEQLRNGRKKFSPVLLICGGLGLAAGIALMVFQQLLPGAVLLVLGAIALAAGMLQHGAVKNYDQNRKTQMELLCQRYYPLDSTQWLEEAERYAQRQRQYRTALEGYESVTSQLENRMRTLKEQTETLTGGKSLRQYEQQLQEAVGLQTALADAVRELRRAEEVVKTLELTCKPVPVPEGEDTMTYSPEETNRLLSDVAAEQKHLHLQLGQCQGQAASLGQPEVLEQQCKEAESRIQKLERMEEALQLAQQTQVKASAELQRRFAPRISHRAQELFGRLTSGRYERITLGEDFSLQACAQGENTLRGSLWRSDGTVDQLYLALRLAVAEELTPEAPLVLDDALVRFDDERLATALDILKQEAREKQVILFTCQSREVELSTR